MPLLPSELSVETFRASEKPKGIASVWLLTHREARFTLQVDMAQVDGGGGRVSVVVSEACFYCRPHSYSDTVRYWGETAHCESCNAEWETEDFGRFRIYEDLVHDELWSQVEEALEARGFDVLEGELIAHDLRAGISHLFHGEA